MRDERKYRAGLWLRKLMFMRRRGETILSKLSESSFKKRAKQNPEWGAFG